MAKPTEYLDNWKFGFVRVDKKGRRTFIIRVQREGKRPKISTGAHDEKTALEEYERWLQDPDGYRPRALGPTGSPGKKPVDLTRELVDEFLAWSAKKGHHGNGNSVGHVANQRIAMDFWIEHLAGRDLRRLNLQNDILPPLKNQPQQANRRRTLRSFYSWLRSEDGDSRLKLVDDPTFKALKVPKADPKRRKKANKAVPWEHLLKVRDALEGHWQATLIVQMATGWHETELARFAKDGSIESYTGPMKTAVAVLICPQHKIGGSFRTVVEADTLKAAQVLRAYGSFEPKNYSRAVRDVATELARKEAKAGVPIEARLQAFTAGQLRHSVATHMINNGATVYEVATFLNHRSLETTKKFYAIHSIPWNPMLGVNPTRVSGQAG